MIRPIGKGWTLQQWQEYETRRQREARIRFAILATIPICYLVYMIASYIVS